MSLFERKMFIYLDIFNSGATAEFYRQLDISGAQGFPGKIVNGRWNSYHEDVRIPIAHDTSERIRIARRVIDGHQMMHYDVHWMSDHSIVDNCQVSHASGIASASTNSAAPNSRREAWKIDAANKISKRPIAASGVSQTPTCVRVGAIRPILPGTSATFEIIRRRGIF